MKVIALLYLLLLCMPSFAADKCYLCSFTFPAKSKLDGEAKSCDDLFGSACVNSEGGSKYQGDSERLSKQMLKNVNEARERGAKALGFKDLRQAVSQKMSDAGLTFNEDFDIMSILTSPFPPLATTAFKVSRDCRNEMEKLNSLDYYGTNDPLQLTRILNRYRLFKGNFSTTHLEFTYSDIPGFVTSHISERCSQLKGNEKAYPKEANQKAYEVCKSFVSVKREAVELFRMEGTEGYEALAKDFVRRNSIPILSGGFVEGGGSRADDLLKKIQRIKGEANTICDDLDQSTVGVMHGVLNDFLSDLSRSKPVIEALVRTYYTGERKEKVEKAFQLARGSIKDLVGSFVQSPERKDKILSEYNSLGYAWLENPPGSYYSSIDNGSQKKVELLDPDKVPLSSDTTHFFDPSLSYFSMLNASYNPSMLFGRGGMRVSETVNMMPGFLLLLDTNPITFLSTFAHEIGHKIGPEISRMNGYNLSGEYTDLLACYRSNNSIKMERGQEDEVIADYISSEVMAREVMKLPKSDREPAIRAMIQDYCLFEDQENTYHTLACRGAHPQNSLRVSGIYGANPSIRRALGCEEKESPNFKNCSLKTSILEVPTIAPSPINGEQQFDDHEVKE